MTLKAVEISGFKSFADKTALYFDQGITGIVGPNGSGKSNLAEAIRWVIGEQSAKSLRGSKMQDIIFAGSDQRPALNVATVSLQFDNHDRRLSIAQDEVAIRRRLFRNGDSEFWLNNQKVRLKDISSLFIAAGLGKNSLAIISQGQVEAVFNSKPEQRRYIIEGPAGVANFKHKKAEAQQQLEQTDANLKRVADIVQELTRQVEPLKAQAQQAQEYQTQKQQYDYWQQLTLAFEIQQLADQKQTALTTAKQLQTQLAYLESQLTRTQQQVAANQQQDQQLTTAIDHYQTQLTSLSRQLEVLKGKQALAAQQSDFNVTNQSAFTAQLTKLQDQSQTLQQTQRQQQEQVASIQQRVHQLQQQIKNLQADFSADPEEMSRKIEQTQQQYLTLLQQQTSLHNQKIYLQRQLQQSQAESDQLQKQMQEQQQTQQQTQQELADLTNEQQTAQQDQEQLQQQIQQQQKMVQQDQEQLSRQQQAADKVVQRWQQTQAEQRSLQRIVQQHQGYYQGVRAVLKAQLPGVVGVVAELIQVPEQFQIALQSAAATQLQSIVTQTQADARQAIDYLRQHHAGRATFLPRNVIQARKIAPRDVAALQQKAGYLGIASDLIQITDGLQNINENLFGSLLVVQTLETAIAISNLIHHRWRVVTLQGDLINPGGSMTGGQVKVTNELLSQKTRLHKLTRTMEQLQQQVHQQKASVQKAQGALEQKHHQLQTLDDQVQQQKQIAQKLDNQLQVKQHQKQTQQQQLQALSFQQQRFGKQIQANQAQLQDSTKQKAAIERQLTAKKQLLTQQKTLLDDFDQQKQNYEQQLQTLQTQLAVATNELNNQQQLLRATQQDTKANQQQIADLKQRLAQLQTATQDLHATHQDVDQRMAKITSQIKTAQEQLAEQQKLRKQIQVKAPTLEEKYQQLFKQQKKLAAAQEDNAVTLANYKNQMQRRLQELETIYQMSFEVATAQLAATQFEPQHAQTQLKQLQQQLTEIGSVNLNAIEEYEQVKDRYEFLQKQQADLITARQQLQTTMQEMDHEVAIRFEQMFTQVAAAFEVIFPKMFGGGKAQLVLTQPDDLLTTGIEIVAQPPGKKLQQLSLLSGGERALTVITLLFAIIKVQPVPFCVLDEVEASLDEANVTRFASYLNKYDTKTQFIVITHRRGTMMRTQRLYGITMQESGVSTVVSIKLPLTNQEVS